VEQKKSYQQMFDHLVAEADDGRITAANEGVKASKLVQICCIDYTTPVLTNRGAVPLKDVQKTDLVWDGVEWVSHGGVADRGIRMAVECFGVRMTADHRVMTTIGWASAGEICDDNAGYRFARETVRLPDSDSPCWINDGPHTMRVVGMSLRVWEDSHTQEPELAREEAAERQALRVPAYFDKPHARNVTLSAIQDMVKYASSVLRRARQGLETVRRAGNNCLSAVAGFVSEFLGRYGRYLSTGIDTGAGRQQRPIRTRELPMGDYGSAGEQQAIQYCNQYTAGEDDYRASCQGIRNKTGDALRAAGEVRLGSGTRAGSTSLVGLAHVADLIDCGPRNRFVVIGDDGLPLIVHNCGTAYGTTGKALNVNAKPRLDEVLSIVHESETKTLVFVPFVSAIAMVLDYLRKAGISAEAIYGDVSKAERDRIFGLFQHTNDVQVIVAQPGAMAHGLTLVRASTIVWYAPTTRPDHYEQANGRITRPGQKHNTLIVHIEGSPIEKKMYDRLKTKASMQGILLNMIREGRE
jgi:hypothetical protein